MFYKSLVTESMAWRIGLKAACTEIFLRSTCRVLSEPCKLHDHPFHWHLLIQVSLVDIKHPKMTMTAVCLWEAYSLGERNSHCLSVMWRITNRLQARTTQLDRWEFTVTLLCDNKTCDPLGLGLIYKMGSIVPEGLTNTRKWGFQKLLLLWTNTLYFQHGIGDALGKFIDTIKQIRVSCSSSYTSRSCVCGIKHWQMEEDFTSRTEASQDGPVAQLRCHLQEGMH